jgi:LPXTG-site transpeptidase (sortase) family protein
MSALSKAVGGRASEPVVDDRLRRRRSRWMFSLVLPVCAVTPWLVPWPWQQAAEGPSSDPSSIIVMAHSQAVTGRAKTAARPPAPSEAEVRMLAATARAGYDMPVTAAAAARVRTTPGPYQRLGRVAIPRVHLDVAFGEGVFAKTLEKGPGHWPGTPMPGQNGNAVLSGHRNTHTAPFKYLNLLKHGDKVVVTLAGGKPVTFLVKDTTIVREAKFKDFVLRQPKEADARTVTLFACHPEGNPVYRIVIRAAAKPE